MTEAMVVGYASHLKDIKSFIKRVNELNDFDLAWRWAGIEDEPLIEVYEKADNHILCIATPKDVISTTKRWMTDWHLEDPDQ